MSDDFSVVREIGNGGFSTVYEIVNPDGERLAKKEMISKDLDDIIRFNREIRLLESIEHKNIVKIISSNVDTEPYYYTMPLANCNLRQYLAIHYGKSEVWVFKQILRGIKIAHDNKIIHRDLKPENILLFSENGENYFTISDFGLGVSLIRDSTVITKTEAFIGTNNYRSPEQLQDPKNVDQLTDIYALGLIFFEILSGKSIPIINFDSIPTEYIHIIRKATQADKTLRYQSIDEFLRDLKSIEDQSYLPSTDFIDQKLSNISNKGYPIDEIHEIINYFILNSSDQWLYRKILPKIDKIILDIIIQTFPLEFETIISHYDNHVSGELEFNYCDKVGQFYLYIFGKSDSNTIKSTIIQRLPRLAYQHHRFYVGEICGSIIETLKDPGLINEIYTMFKENPNLADFCKPYFCDKQIPIILQEFCQNSH